MSALRTRRTDFVASDVRAAWRTRWAPLLSLRLWPSLTVRLRPSVTLWLRTPVTLWLRTPVSLRLRTADLRTRVVLLIVDAPLLVCSLRPLFAMRAFTLTMLRRTLPRMLRTTLAMAVIPLTFRVLPTIMRLRRTV